MARPNARHSSGDGAALYIAAESSGASRACLAPERCNRLRNLAQDKLCQRHKLDIYPFTTSGHLFTDAELVDIAAGDDDERRIVAVMSHRRSEDEKGKLEFIVRFDDGTEDIQKYADIRYVEQLQVYMNSHEDDEDIRKLMTYRRRIQGRTYTDELDRPRLDSKDAAKKKRETRALRRQSQ